MGNEGMYYVAFMHYDRTVRTFLVKAGEIGDVMPRLEEQVQVYSPTETKIEFVDLWPDEVVE